MELPSITENIVVGDRRLSTSEWISAESRAFQFACWGAGTKAWKVFEASEPSRGEAKGGGLALGVGWFMTPLKYRKVFTHAQDFSIPFRPGPFRVQPEFSLLAYGIIHTQYMQHVGIYNTLDIHTEWVHVHHIHTYATKRHPLHTFSLNASRALLCNSHSPLSPLPILLTKHAQTERMG